MELSDVTLLRRKEGMLILSRTRGERIVIGDDVFITVLEVRGDKVRLGIEAPTSVPVRRGEVWGVQGRKSNAKGGEADTSLPRPEGGTESE